MKKLLVAVVGLTTLVVGAALILVGPRALLLLLKYPQHAFQEDSPVDAPNYSKASAWALYGHSSAPDVDVGVDVFFIHPTGYFRGDHWNSRLRENSAANHNRRWMMANMASVFNDFPIYAPKYREATIYAFFDLEGDNGKAALALAYSDVQAAFTAFIARSNGRPFIVAGHSQGTVHGVKLLREIEKGPHASRLVAAYLPGGLQQSMTEGLNTSLCADPTQTRCYVAWSTYDASYVAEEQELIDPYICVNPISWQIDGSAEKAQHLGMVPESSQVSFQVIGEDQVPYVDMPPLSPAVSAYTSARCLQGLLRVDIPDPENYNPFTPGDYHNYDYSLFHMDVKANAHLRAGRFLSGE